MQFKPWPKITRIENRRKPIFTEKIDGTNACIVCSFGAADENIVGTYITEVGPLNIWVQSRSRFITPTNDNFGFAKFVSDNLTSAALLGEGYHFGEWWGLGIQRGYDLPEKRFSLFNTRRWNEHNPPPKPFHVVPTLPISSVEEVQPLFTAKGSFAAPGYYNVEGAIMYEPDTDTCFKVILNK